MKMVQKYQTQDGVIHDSEHQARRYVDMLYGKGLTKLAHDLVQLQKFTQVQDFIDTRLDEFVRLKALRDDAQLEPTQGDNEA